MKEKIQQLAEKYFNETVRYRRHLHANPELSFQEFETSLFIKNELEAIGVPYRDGFVKTGIVAKLECKDPNKKVVALRADIDALPVVEANNIKYKSKNEGIMHACGHDVHASSLLGVAKILFGLKDELEGTILFVFQPAEEKLPGGAKLMLEEGAFSNIRPGIIIGQHVMPGMPVGKVGFKPGMYMASADEVYLTIKGKGGHGAMPHQLTDTVLVTSHVIVALQQVVSRNAHAAIPSVLSFGKVDAPGATNVIPSEVKVEGTFRTMDESWRAEAHDRIRKIASTVAEGMGAECEVDIKVGYPCLTNDAEVTNRAQALANEYLGKENVETLDLRMTAEDFAYFSQEFPATFYRLGIMDEAKTLTAPLHSSNFNIDENALKTSIGTMAYIAVGLLK